MKKVLLLVSVLTLVVAFAAIAAQTPPEKVDLKTSWGVTGSQKNVIFTHAQHTAKMKCEECHATADGGGKLKPAGDIKGTSATNAAHNYCWTCHAKQSPDPVKKVCAKCHKGK